MKSILRSARAWVRPSAIPTWGVCVGLSVAGLALFVAFAPRAYHPPFPEGITDVQAFDKAGQILTTLRPTSHPQIARDGYETSQAIVFNKLTDDPEWRFGFFDRKTERVYQIRLAKDGAFRSFRTFSTATGPKKDRLSDLLAPQAAADHASALLDLVKSPLPVAAPAPRFDAYPSPGGDQRREVKWTLAARDQSPARTARAVFEGTDLQTLESVPTTGDTSLTVGGSVGSSRGINFSIQGGEFLILRFMAGLLLGLIGLLPVLVVFFKGLQKREMVSREVFLSSFALVSVLMLLAVGGILLQLLSRNRTDFHNFQENPISSGGNLPTGFPLFLALTFIGVALVFVAGFFIICLTILLSVAEACDWEARAGVLEDWARVVRRRFVPWERIGHMYVVGTALGLWLLGFYTALPVVAGRQTDWLGLRGFSKYFAADLFPTGSFFGIGFYWVAAASLWWTPLLCVGINRFRNWFGAMVGLTAFLTVAYTLCLGESVFFNLGLAGIIFCFLFTTARSGLFTSLFGLTAAFALFPMLWGLLNPSRFHFSLLTGVPVLAVPLLLGLLRYVAPKQGRSEDFELAPPYIRDRFTRERVKEELQIRWTIHQNLIPASGQVLREAKIAVEYFHTPELGRELFAFIPLGSNRLGVAIGEVSGKGLEASMLLAVALTTLKSKAIHFPDSPSQAMQRVHEYLSPRLHETGAQIQLLYGVADFTRLTMTFCNAGYVPPMLLSQSSASSEETDPVFQKTLAGPPVGRAENPRFGEYAWRLVPGDKIALTSDWMWDLFDPTTSDFPLERKLHESLRQFADLSPKELAREVVAHAQTIQEAQGKPPIEVTILCLEF